MLNTELAPSWHPLSEIDQWLLASGWRHDAGRGFYPAHWEAHLLPGHYLLNHYSRSAATMYEIDRQESFKKL